MSATTTTAAPDAPTIVMTRVYDAPRALVWEAMTEPRHVRAWWGGPGCTSPVCEMDLRAGGRWHHVLRFPDGTELDMRFEFVEVAPPARLVWRGAGTPGEAMPQPEITVTLDALGARTRWTMVARFASIAERDRALSMGFTGPIAASSDRLVAHLERS